MCTGAGRCHAGNREPMAEHDNPEITRLQALAELDRFRLYARADILQILRGLAKKPEIVTAYFGGGQEYLLTAVVGVQPQEGRLILDCGADELVNRKAQRTERFLCVAKQDRIDIRFECGPLSLISHGGYPAFITALPEWVQRLQRREYFRVRTLITNPVLCRIDGVDYPVVDISLGGIGMLDERQQLNCAVGERFHGCRITLPDFGEFPVELEVRNVSTRQLRPGNTGNRLGLAFVGFPRDKQNLVQRYLQHLQLRARSLDRS
jgi:flagellar brake protein